MSEQLEDFFEDFENSKKNIKLFTSFSKTSAEYKKKEIEITEPPKKKFQPKVKVINKLNNKGIF